MVRYWQRPARTVQCECGSLTGPEILAAERMVLLQPEPVYTVDFSPDGGSLMVGGEGGDIRIYFVEIEALKTFADSRLADRSLSNDECRKYFHTPDCPPLPRIDE